MTTAYIDGFDQLQAEAEGWGLFEAEDGYQLQHHQDKGLLSSDAEAWALVVDRALAGSAYHLNVLRALEVHAAHEFALIAESLSGHQAIALAARMEKQ